MGRMAEVKRVTKETDIYMNLNLDGEGRSCVDTGIGFLTTCSKVFPNMAFLIWKL